MAKIVGGLMVQAASATDAAIATEVDDADPEAFTRRLWASLSILASPVRIYFSRPSEGSTAIEFAVNAIWNPATGKWGHASRFDDAWLVTAGHGGLSVRKHLYDTFDFDDSGWQGGEVAAGDVTVGNVTAAGTVSAASGLTVGAVDQVAGATIHGPANIGEPAVAATSRGDLAAAGKVVSAQVRTGSLAVNLPDILQDGDIAASGNIYADGNSVASLFVHSASAKVVAAAFSSPGNSAIGLGGAGVTNIVGCMQGGAFTVTTQTAVTGSLVIAIRPTSFEWPGDAVAIACYDKNDGKFVLAATEITQKDDGATPPLKAGINFFVNGDVPSGTTLNFTYMVSVIAS